MCLYQLCISGLYSHGKITQAVRLDEDRCFSPSHATASQLDRDLGFDWTIQVLGFLVPATTTMLHYGGCVLRVISSVGFAPNVDLSSSFRVTFGLLVASHSLLVGDLL